MRTNKRRKRRRLVVIEVDGGCAFVKRKPKDVSVTIIDRDSEAVGQESVTRL